MTTDVITTLARFSALALVAAIVVLSLVPPGLRPVTRAPRQLERAAIFAAAGAAFALGYRGRLAAVAMLLTAVVFSGTLQLAKIMVPGRHVRLSSVIIEAASAWLMIILVLWKWEPSD